MYEFIKKNIYLIILFIITLSIGFLTFLTFIDKGFIELSDQNLQILLVLNIALLISRKIKTKSKINKIMFSINKYCKFSSDNSIKPLSIKVKKVKKPIDNVIINNIIRYIFFLINSYI